MRNFFIVIGYTIKQAIKKKSFWVVNVIMAFILFIIFAIASNISSSQFSFASLMNEESILELTAKAVQTIKSSEKTEEQKKEDIDNIKNSIPKILVADEQNIFGKHLDLLLETDYSFEIAHDTNSEAIMKSLENEEFYSAVVLLENKGVISFDYIVQKEANYNKTDVNIVSNLLKQLQANQILGEFGASSEKLDIINTQINYNVNVLNESNFINTAMLVSTGLAIILFFSVYFYSSSISASIASEKTSRVIETLVSSTSPHHIIIGKTIGMGILGIMQLIFLCMVCILSYRLLISSDLTFLNELISSLNLSPINIAILIVYFLLGYILFAFLNAITGATVSKPEDIQMANIPISLIATFSLVISFFAYGPPEDPATIIALMFPFSSPFAMPGRMLTRIYRHITNYCVTWNSYFISIITCIYLNQNIFCSNTTLWK
jgi:ABC-2 type transport system permease protein